MDGSIYNIDYLNENVYKIKNGKISVLWKSDKNIVGIEI